MLLELGGGTNPHRRADWVLDTRHPHDSPPQDVSDIPWRTYYGEIPNDFLDEVYASHLMEHIPKGEPLIRLMNEAWRVLKPGGSFTMIMPLIGYEIPGEMPCLVESWHPYADPTHVQYWYLPHSLEYFAHDTAVSACADYGLQPWVMGGWVSEAKATSLIQRAVLSPADPTPFWSVRGGWEGVARIQKP